ncbi:MAG: transcription termination factor NusA [Puniceicoccales bacterium]|jgi:N utilization substance protein A|nr:transcription termination factor NusA [Puniceicoccales bacterium]
MSNEILSVLNYMEKEKGISRADMIETIKSNIEHAAERGINAGQKLEVSIDSKTGKLSAVVLLTVVDSVSDSTREIHIAEAGRLSRTTPKIGDIMRKEFNPAELGRIAAQATRQGIMQRVRQFEKDRIFDEFKDQVGSIVAGVVRRRERGDVIIDLGKAEATLPAREHSSRDDFATGDRVRCLLLAIEARSGGPEIILSRSNPAFVQKMLENEVSEIGDGTVFIAALAREPGFRTKIAVDSRDPKVDPVGACVGPKGTRVRTIVKELNEEKVDIVRWHNDPVQMLHEAIKPAVARNVLRDDENRRLTFEVSESDLAIAIGRRGQNAKLTSRLIGWRLDIRKEVRHAMTLEKKKERAVSGLSNIPGIDGVLAEKLVPKGFTSLEAFEDVTAEDLVDVGIEAAEAVRVIEAVTEARGRVAPLSPDAAERPVPPTPAG